MAVMAVAFAVLVLGVGVSAGKVTMTIWPVSGLGMNGILFEYVTPLATEFGFEVTDQVELVAGVDFLAESDDDTVTILNLGGRYYLVGEGKAKPFLFGNFSRWDDGSSDALIFLKGGVGVACAVNEKVDIMGQTGMFRGSDSDYSWLQTFSTVGLRFRF